MLVAPAGLDAWRRRDACLGMTSQAFEKSAVGGHADIIQEDLCVAGFSV